MMAVILWALSLFDAIATLYMVHLCDAVELNPLMAPLLPYPWLFLCVKQGLMALCVVAMHRARAQTFPRRALNVLVGVYALLACYHVFGLVTC